MESAIQMPQDLNVLFRNLSFSTADKYISNIDLSNRGDGIKARHIPAILRYIQNNVEKNRTKYAIAPSYIWGFEEPENGVEFYSCFEMADELIESKTERQILITTHSPAFYSVADLSGAKRFFVSKGYRGDSIYTDTMSDDEIGEIIGLMPVVAPFINKEHEKYQNKIKSMQKYMNEMEKEISKTIILTEGKTDWMHLKNAWDTFRKGGLYKEFDLHIEEYEECRGNSELESILRYISKISRKNSIIGVFDNDNPKGRNYIRPVELGNNVYACCIEDVWGYCDEISIELLYKREELIRETDEKRRIFLSDEFSTQAHRLLDNSEIVSQNKTISDAHKREIVKVVDSEVFNINNEQIALSKADFARMVLNKEKPFDNMDVSGFLRIFDIIGKIITGKEYVNGVAVLNDEQIL